MKNGVIMLKKKEEKRKESFHHADSIHPHVKPSISSPILSRFKSIFPFQLFPDELIVEEERIIWLHRYGPWMCEVVTILPEEIAKVEVSVGPLFGHVHVMTMRHQIEILVERLSRAATLRARDIIEGLAEAKKHNVRLKGTPGEKVEQLVKLVHVDV